MLGSPTAHARSFQGGTPGEDGAGPAPNTPAQILCEIFTHPLHTFVRLRKAP